MKTLKTGFDMDGMMVNLLGPWLKSLAERHPPLDVTIDDITEFKMEKCAKLAHLSRNQILDVLSTPDYFANLPAIDGAIETITRVHEAGHEVHIVTALPGSGKKAEVVQANKLAWLAKHLPFQLSFNRIHFAEADQKAEHTMDVFVDDRGETCIAYKQQHPGALVMAIKYPYNQAILRDAAEIVLVDDHKNTCKAWAEIEQRIYYRAAQGS